jgi:PKD repeat protein
MSKSFLSIVKPLFILLFSGISLTSLSQCPTTLTQSVVSQSGNQLVIQPVFDIAPPSEVMNGTLSNGVTSYSVLGMTTSTITYTNITAGSYSVCLNANFSTSGCPPLTHCMPVTVSGSNPCPTVLTPSIVANSGGQVSILPVFDVVPTSGSLVLWMTSGSTSYTAGVTSMTNVITQTNVATGTYSVCLSANYLNSGCASVTGCVQIAVAGPTLCPTVLTPSIITNSGGQVWLKPVFDVVPASGVLTLWMNSGLNSYTTTTTSMTNLIANTNLAAGNYSLCLTASSLNAGCVSLTGCTQVTVTAGPCPTVLTPSIVTNSGGQVSILPVFDVVPTSGVITQWMDMGLNSYTATTTSMTNVITHTNVAAGTTYSLCLQASSLNSGCPSVSGCIYQVTVTPTIQCPTVLTQSVISQVANQLIIQPVFDIAPPTGLITGVLSDGVTSHTVMSYPTTTITYTNAPAGSYSVCLTANFSSSGCPTLTNCSSVTVFSTSACPTVLTPSIVANSGGQVSILPVFDVVPTSGIITSAMNLGINTDSVSSTSMINAITHYSVTPGNHNVCLYANYLNSGCPSVSGCAQVFVWPVCQPGFTYSTDVNCVTHFINTSTGASLTHHWDINGVTYTTTDVSVSLPNGSYQVELINNTMTGPSSYISCDTLNQTVSVLCPTTSTLCSANASFSVSPDPATPGHYFVYDISTATGTRSYLWDFGDGTTSTQQHPVHQYATPGQYVICLTISGTSGTVSCSSTRCDSSSVRRVASGFFMSQVTVVPGGPTSVKEKDATEHLKVYPNPVSESLTLDLGTLDQALHYALTDIYGRMVAEGEITGSKTSINTSLLPNGFYILNITNATGDSLKTVKIVK